MTNKIILGAIIAAVFVVGTISVSLFDSYTESDVATNSNTDLNASNMAYAQRSNGVFDLDELVSPEFQNGNPLIFENAKCVAGASGAHWCELEGTVDTGLFGFLAEAAYSNPAQFGTLLAEAMSIITDDDSDAQLTMLLVQALNSEFATTTGNVGFNEIPGYSELSFSEEVIRNDDGSFSSELKWYLSERW